MNPPAPWLAFYDGMPHHLEYPATTMFRQIQKTAGQYPTLPAYDFMGKITTYRRLMERIERTASAFAAYGIGQGDRVTLCLPNIPQAIDAFYALHRIGAVPNMIHPLSAPEEIAFYLNRSQSKMIITLDTFYDKVAGILPALHRPCRVVIASIARELPAGKRLVFSFTPNGKKAKLPKTGYVLWQDFIKAGHTLSLPDETVSPEEPAAILYSGGTTGTAKGILLSHKNFNALALQTIAASGCETIAGTKMLSVMPIFHGFGLGIGIHTALVGGACCVLVPRFTVDSYAKLVKSKKPDFIPGVPTLFAALLQAKSLQNADLSFLKGVFAGGDSLSVDLKKRVDAFLKAHGSPVPIREGYGTTECVTASCLTPLRHGKEGSIGIPYPDTYYTIVTPDTVTPLPAGTEGEICISGPSVMLGYLDDPRETGLAIRTHADGRRWLHTGDLGYMDGDGFVYFRQRIKRVIITNGYKVYPTQIEKALWEHPGVASCCVIGVKDPYRGQRIRAYVVKKGNVTAEELLAFCGRYIAKYALPKEILFKDRLPQTLVGKTDYRALEEEANEEQP